MLKIAIFPKSFKNQKKILYCFGLDIALYAVIFLIYLLTSAIISSQTGYLEEAASELNYIVSYSLNSIDDPEIMASEAENVYISLKAVLAKVGVTIVIFIILIFAILMLFKSLIWRVILEKKFSRHFYLKFIYANLVWFFMWIVLFAFLSITKLPMVIISRLLLIFMVFFTLIFLSMFDEKKPMLSLIKNPLKLGIRKIHKLILSLILVYLCIIALYIAFSIQLTYIIALIILFIAWFRIYTYLAVKNLLASNKF